jgi:hypothetical protein
MQALLPPLSLLVALLAWPAPGTATQALPAAPPPWDLPAPLAREAGSLLSALARQDTAAVELTLAHLVELRAEAGIPNLTPVAAAFRGAFPEATARTAPGEAVRLAQAAVALAPDDPGLRWLLARTQLRRGTDGLGAAAGAALDGLEAFTRHPRIFLVAVANGSLYLTAALIGVLIFVALALVARHGRLLAHDLGDLFPAAPATAFSTVEMARSRRLRAIVGSGLTRVLASSMAGLLLLLPPVLGFGLVPSLVLWIVLLLPYLRRAELALAAGGFAVLAILPLLASLVLLPGRAATSDGAVLWSALAEVPAEDLTARLARRAMEHPGEPWAPVLQARAEVRRAPLLAGALAIADERLRAVTPDPTGVVATDLANVRLRRALASCSDGRPDRNLARSAQEQFQQALRQAPGTAPVLRGLALSSGLADDREGADRALQALVAVTSDADLESLARLRALTARGAACATPSQVAAELRTPAVPAWDLYLLDVPPLALPPVLPLNGLLLARTPVSWLPILGVGGLLAVVLMLGLRGRLPFASACPRCGTISCSSCNREASGFDYCPTCLFEQVKPAFLDPLDLMAQRQRREERHGWSRTAIPLLGLLIPGTGQMLAGRPVRGALMLLVLFLVVAAVAYPVPPVIDVPGYAGAPATGLPLWPPVSLALVYAWSALDTWWNRGP